MLHRHEHITYRIIDAFFRHWRVSFLAFLGVTSVVAAVILTRPASYTADASIRIVGESDLSKALGMSQQNIWVTPADENVRHFSDLMRDVLPGGFVDSALRAARLDKPIEVSPQARDPRFAELIKRVYANSDSKDVFTIGLVWDDRSECERIVNALQEAYIAEAGLSRQSAAINQAEFFKSQIESLANRLSKAQSALMDYKMKNSGKLPEAQASELERYSNLRMERDILQATANDDVLKVQGITERLAHIKPVSVLEQTISADPLQMQIRQLQAKRDAAIADNYNPTGSTVQTYNDQIKALETQFAARQSTDPTQSRNVVETKVQDNPEYLELSQQLMQARMDQKQHQFRHQKLGELIAQYDEQIKKLPLAERQLNEKMRDYTVIEDQYKALLKRREDALIKAKVDNITATSTMTRLNPIYAQSTSSGKKKAFTLAASCVLGLVVGCMMIVLREWSDPTLRYESDATRLLGVPVLASLPESTNLQFPLPAPRGGLLRRVTPLAINGEKQKSSDTRKNGFHARLEETTKWTPISIETESGQESS